MCDEYGYYEVSRGYRKIPGNICTGGLQMSPYRYQCNIGGYSKSIFSLKGIFMLCVLAAILYYGWPIIEAILLVLPIPDPKSILSSLAGIFRKIKSKLTDIGT
jgi:hypothetical protein